MSVLMRLTKHFTVPMGNVLGLFLTHSKLISCSMLTHFMLKESKVPHSTIAVNLTDNSIYVSIYRLLRT
jgi:hypothetical protein